MGSHSIPRTVARLLPERPADEQAFSRYRYGGRMTLDKLQIFQCDTLLKHCGSLCTSPAASYFRVSEIRAVIIIFPVLLSAKAVQLRDFVIPEKIWHSREICGYAFFRHSLAAVV